MQFTLNKISVIHFLAYMLSVVALHVVFIFDIKFTETNYKLTLMSCLGGLLSI